MLLKSQYIINSFWSTLYRNHATHTEVDPKGHGNLVCDKGCIWNWWKISYLTTFDLWVATCKNNFVS
jgi:hypothetical protein